MNGVDYSFWRPPSPSYLLQQGWGFVCRYLAPLPNGKVIDKAEFDGLRAAGVQVVLNWEYGTDDFAGGYAAGQQAAAQAVQQAGALGAWPCPIIFSCDTDPANIGQGNVVSFMQGVNSVIGVQYSGIYGGYYAVAWAMNAGVATYGWQTFAWSAVGARKPLDKAMRAVKLHGLANRLTTTWHGPAQLRQTGGDANVDYNVSLAADFGQVGGHAAAAVEYPIHSSDA